jgi:hypothetical protein
MLISISSGPMAQSFAMMMRRAVSATAAAENADRQREPDW